jgi:hypothetical protein
MQRRPHLMSVLNSLNDTGKQLLTTGLVPERVDFDVIGTNAGKALDADQVDTARDNCYWASLEWKRTTNWSRSSSNIHIGYPNSKLRLVLSCYSYILYLIEVGVTR